MSSRVHRVVRQEWLPPDLPAAVPSNSHSFLEALVWGVCFVLCKDEASHPGAQLSPGGCTLIPGRMVTVFVLEELALGLN